MTRTPDGPAEALGRALAEIERLRADLAHCRECLNLTDTEENRLLRAEIERLRGPSRHLEGPFKVM